LVQIAAQFDGTAREEAFRMRRRELPISFRIHPTVLFLHLAWALTLLPGTVHAERKGEGTSLVDRFVDGDIDAFDALSLSRGAPHRFAAAGEAYRGMFLTLGGSVGRSSIRDESGAFVVLGLPFDALFDPRPKPPIPPVQHALYEEAGLPTRVSTASTAPPSFRAPNVTVATEPSAEVAPPSPTYARSVVAAAYRAASVGDGLGRLDDLASRARKSALLPEVRLRATRYVDDRASVDALADQNRFTDSSSQNLGLEARLTFRLDRLAFADEEPGLERARLDVLSFRAKLAQKALELLFKHHRARVIAREPGPEREEAAVVSAELAAALDALTAGWFSRNPP